MRIKSFLIILIGTLICALSFNVFLSAYEIIPGGVGGIAIIFNRIFNLNEGLVVGLLSLFCLILGFIFLGKKDVLRSILGSIFFSLFIYLTALLLTKVTIHIDNRLLASLVGGFLYGFGIGLVYKEGYTTGGADIIAKIMHQKMHISLGIAVFIIDLIITICGAIFFGFETLIYSILTIYIYSIVIDKVTLGFFPNKSFYIITTNPEKIKEYVLKELHHGVTEIKGKGAFSNEDKYILLVVIPERDYYRLKDGLKKYDKNAFFVVSNSYEVGGGK